MPVIIENDYIVNGEVQDEITDPVHAEINDLIQEYAQDLHVELLDLLGEENEFDIEIRVEQNKPRDEVDPVTQLLYDMGFDADEVEEIYARAAELGDEGEQKSHRRDILEEAIELIDGDRNADYGDPIQDFRRTGKYWSGHLAGVLGRKAHQTGVQVPADVMELVESLVDPHDVAIMMSQLKISRLAWSPQKRDNWTDNAGYTGCGWDCVSRENDE